MQFTSLSNYLILQVFSFLPITSYKSLILTCHQFNNLVTTNQPLLQSWCISKFPKYITATLPLPNDADYNWLIKCLINDISEHHDRPSCKYGYVDLSGILNIRSILCVTHVDRSRVLITQGIRITHRKTLCHVGTFANDILQGHGRLIKANKSYVGEFQDGYYHGFGAMAWKNGESYHGYFEDNCKSGRGTHKYADGSHYVGRWSNGNQHGHGSYHWANGDCYVGQFSNGSFHGLGEFSRCANGQMVQVYSGMWCADVPRDCDLDYTHRQCLSKIKR